MKSSGRLIIFVLALLALVASAHAQSPREELQQMVEQLQKTPNDNTLREKIIKLGAMIRPEVPDEAEKYEGRAKFAFKNAKSTADYADAAKEYEKALQAAPWIPGYYSDLCTIYEKAGLYVDAKRNCEIYVKTLADRSQISETKQRIAGLEFGIEQAEKANLEKAKKAKTLIIPGVGIGGIRLGMLESQVVDVLGAPLSRTPFYSDISMRSVTGFSLEYGNLIVAVRNDRGVIGIYTRRPGFVTSEGVGVGSSKGEVSSAMGSPMSIDKRVTGQEHWQYNGGLLFSFGFWQSSPTVSEVGVSTE